MTEANDKRYCWTCRRWIPPAWWERHTSSLNHLRAALEGPPSTGSTGKTRRPADPPDTRSQCGRCSRRITSGFEYHLDDGRAYHNNSVPLATTRPRNRPQTAQGTPQQAGKLVAGVVVQLGTWEGVNA